VGILPTILTPWSSRSNRSDGTIPRTTTMMVRGNFGKNRRKARSRRMLKHVDRERHARVRNVVDDVHQHADVALTIFLRHAEDLGDLVDDEPEPEEEAR
jgi:hypothetical protein